MGSSLYVYIYWPYLHAVILFGIQICTFFLILKGADFCEFTYVQFPTVALAGEPLAVQTITT